MAVLKTATRTAQWPLTATFSWTWEDTMANTAGNTVDFGKTNAGGAAGAFDVIKLPKGAMVTGGYIQVTTTFDTAGYDVIVGDADSTNRYFATADLKTAGAAQALTPTSYVSTGQNIRVTFASDDVCTAGAATLVVTYVIDGRSNEVVPN